MSKTFEYTITGEDYLVHQLFEASRNPVVRSQRRKGLMLWSTLFFILALVFWFQDNQYLGLYFLLFGVGFIFIYPFYIRWIYKRYYTRYINKILKNKKGELMLLNFEEEEITISNEGNEGKINNENIISIYEISSHIFIKLEEGRNLIIPKTKVKNLKILQKQLKTLAGKYSAEYNEMMDWKW